MEEEKYVSKETYMKLYNRFIELEKKLDNYDLDQIEKDVRTHNSASFWIAAAIAASFLVSVFS